jgi:hypothetical protein
MAQNSRPSSTARALLQTMIRVSDLERNRFACGATAVYRIAIARALPYARLHTNIRSANNGRTF